ncbi:hypothetical protein CF336_g9540, partial [Tilletia laevis]
WRKRRSIKASNSPPTSTPPSTSTSTTQEHKLFGTLALALYSARTPRKTHTTFLLKGWRRTAIPAWASAEEATPTKVRDPPVLHAATTPTTSVAAAAAKAPAPVVRAVVDLDSAPGMGARAERAVEVLASRAAKRLSASSSAAPAAAASTSTAGPAITAPLVSHAGAASHASAAVVDARYNDLEDFFDDEDEDEDMEEVEVELDEDAREDGEYEYEDDDEEGEGERGEGN